MIVDRKGKRLLFLSDAMGFENVFHLDEYLKQIILPPRTSSFQASIRCRLIFLVILGNSVSFSPASVCRFWGMSPGTTWNRDQVFPASHSPAEINLNKPSIHLESSNAFVRPGGENKGGTTGAETSGTVTAQRDSDGPLLGASHQLSSSV